MDTLAPSLSTPSSKRSLAWYALAGILVVLGVFFVARLASGVKNAPVAGGINEVRPHRPGKGDVNAPNLIIEYGDFQCPYCRQAEPGIAQLLERFGSRVRFEFREFPLFSIHSRATATAIAAECAHAQGKFWEYHDMLYAHQDKLDDVSLAQFGRDIGLDMNRFGTCYSQATPLPIIQKEYQEGAGAGISGTPTFFVNGQKIEGMPTLEEWATLLQ